MYHAVAHRCYSNVTSFLLIHDTVMIPTMFILPRVKFCTEPQQVVFQINFESNDITARLLASPKSYPRAPDIC